MRPADPAVTARRAPPARRVRLLSRVLLGTGAVMLLSAPSCGAVDDVVRGARSASQDVGALSRSPWTSPQIRRLPVSMLPSSEEIRAASARIAAPVADVPAESQKEVVDDACQVADAVQASGGSEDDVRTYVATRFDNGYSYRLQMEELGTKLLAARGAQEHAVVLGQAALCTWASSD